MLKKHLEIFLSVIVLLIFSFSCASKPIPRSGFIGGSEKEIQKKEKAQGETLTAEIEYERNKEKLEEKVEALHQERERIEREDKEREEKERRDREDWERGESKQRERKDEEKRDNAFDCSGPLSWTPEDQVARRLYFYLKNSRGYDCASIKITMSENIDYDVIKGAKPRAYKEYEIDVEARNLSSSCILNYDGFLKYKGMAQKSLAGLGNIHLELAPNNTDRGHWVERIYTNDYDAYLYITFRPDGYMVCRK
jgi:hypothetical protein